MHTVSLLFFEQNRREEKQDNFQVLLKKFINMAFPPKTSNNIVLPFFLSPPLFFSRFDSHQSELGFRGKFITDEEGRWSFRTLRMRHYPVPTDGPVVSSSTSGGGGRRRD